MASLSDVFTDPEMTNWLKAWRAIAIAKSGLEQFVENEAKTLHGNIYNAVWASVQAPVSCIGCHTANLLKCPSKGICNKRGAHGLCTSMHDTALKQPRQCPANVCNKVLDEIAKQHKFSNPSWKNSLANHWASNPWQIAKAYLPPDGYTEKSSVRDTDFNGLINFMLNCKHFDKMFSFSIAPGKPHQPCLLTKARDFGKTARHSSTCKVTDTDLQDIFMTLTSLLTDSKCLAHDVAAREAVRQLAKLQTDFLNLTTEEIVQLFEAAQAQGLCEAEEEELVLYKNMNFTMVTRNQWYAKSSKENEQYMTMPVSHVFIHHTMWNECFSQRDCALEMRKLQHLHQAINGWADIGYNFVIGQDGRVYMGRGWNRVGAHTLGWNKKSISFAFMGNFTEKLPTYEALNAIEAALAAGVKLDKLTRDFKLHGHRDARPTESPGQKLYDMICKHPHYQSI